MEWIVHLLLNGLVVFVVAKVLPGVRVSGFLSAVTVALVYGLLNYLLKTLLVVVTFPAVILTFGLFLLVLNAFLLWITDKLLKSFEIRSTFSLMLATLGITLGSMLVDRFVGRMF
jgi:putative membrane protein